MLTHQITELEQYLNDRGLNIPIDEDEEQISRIVRINEACREIYSNPDITPQGKQRCYCVI